MDQMVYRQLANIISASLAGTDANGVVDLSSKLDDEISILRVESDSRISSVDTNYFDPPIPVTTSATRHTKILRTDYKIYFEV